MTETSAEEGQDTLALADDGADAGGARLELLSEGTSIAQAREAARQFLHRSCTWAPSVAVTLVVSELVTNAVRHTSGWWRLGLTADAGNLVVEIEDTSSEPPRPRPGSLAGEGGLGLDIVAKLVPRFEVQLAPAGAGKKVRAIWFRT